MLLQYPYFPCYPGSLNSSDNWLSQEHLHSTKDQKFSFDKHPLRLISDYLIQRIPDRDLFVLSFPISNQNCPKKREHSREDQDSLKRRTMQGSCFLQFLHYPLRPSFLLTSRSSGMKYSS